MLEILKNNIFDKSFDLYIENDFRKQKTDAIDKFINSELKKSIKKSDDQEYVSLEPSINYNLTFNFLSANTFSSNYLYAGFSKPEIDFNSISLKESLYIFDIFDSKTFNNKNLISRNFVSLRDLDLTTSVIKYTVSKIKPEYNYIYIPNFYTASTAYIQISFFNSKTGNVRLFSTKTLEIDNDSVIFEISVNKNTKKWSFQIVPSNLYEVIETNPVILKNDTTSVLKQIKKTKKTITTKGTFI